MSKIKFSYYALCIFVFLITSNCSDSESSPSPDPVVEIESYTAYDVSYGSEENQNFDIYLPSGRTEDTKVLILVHGGSWISGDKSDMNEIVDYVQESHPNLGVVNINYRLASVGVPPVPMQTDDITAVVNYLVENKEELVIGDSIGFIGVSAGAHLSMLWSYAYDASAKVDLVCSIVGPSNFTDPAYYESTNPLYQAFYLLFGNPSISFLESVSPYHMVTNSAPPTQLFYGGMDYLVPNSQGIDLNDKLDELGVTHQFTFYANEGHGWEGTALNDTYQKISNYIDMFL